MIEAQWCKCKGLGLVEVQHSEGSGWLCTWEVPAELALAAGRGCLRSMHLRHLADEPSSSGFAQVAVSQKFVRKCRRNIVLVADLCDTGCMPATISYVKRPRTAPTAAAPTISYVHPARSTAPAPAAPQRGVVRLTAANPTYVIRIGA